MTRPARHRLVVTGGHRPRFEPRPAHVGIGVPALDGVRRDPGDGIDHGEPGAQIADVPVDDHQKPAPTHARPRADRVFRGESLHRPPRLLVPGAIA